MKPKFAAAIAVAVWLAVVAWTGTMVVAKPAVLRLNESADETSAMAELRNATARNARAQAALGGMRSLGADAGSGPVIALAPERRTDADGQPLDPAAPQGDFVHRLELIVAAGSGRHAVVDGNDVTVGSRLPGGARVVAIGLDSVRIEDASGRRDLHVQPAFPADEG
ncbi:hypothetical protein [Coralloluteibacterium stylophorae]|uniref:Uncharacterized protein n=1 Tax=Coralloluteibacterium stylophorae TaxID=1776034 RepID=A0A8J8AYD2_9GAMM|nr:hypothetical protein [Coralloluteibacterium stylophorae]MBS7456793.1 hypothetical protein [Coralloluteibacterium stylophorae]